jgi:hypothetical protein
MSGHIFNIQDDGKLVEMNEAPFSNEDIFQSLLEQYPNLLAGDQINSAEPRRWLLICREMGVPAEELGSDRWSLDHLFLDQDAMPTLVEVKRSSDTRIRREVVGQMLDYAANAVVHWSIDQITNAYRNQCDSDGTDPDQQLAKFLGDDRDPDEFWLAVKTNLQAGKVRMLFVADAIPSELKRIVEFLNVQMDPAEVLAVEVKQYVGTGLKTLVPRVIGQTAEAEIRKGSGRRKSPRTEEELQQIADERGVGEAYATLVSQMKPLFDSTYTTRSNIGFEGKIEGVKSTATIASLSSVHSLPERGLPFDIYVDRLAEFFSLQKQQVIDSLPACDEIKDTGNWGAGDIHRGFTKSAADFEPLLTLMKQAKSN